MESSKAIIQLKALYKECFNDGDEITSHLFSAKLGTHNAVTSILNNQIEGALYLVEKSMSYREKNITYPFIVAVGVNKSQRGKGIAKEIIKKAFKKCYQDNRAFVGLYPAINDFYEKLQFTFITNETTLNKENLSFKVSEDKELILNIYQQATLGLDFYYQRTINDIENRLKEIEADRGKAELIYRQEELAGFVFAGGEEYVLDGSINFDPKGVKINGHMARIVNLKAAFSLTDITIPFAFRVKDDFIEDNNVSIKVTKGKMEIVEKALHTIDIAELTALFFGCHNAFTNSAFDEYFKEVKGQISEKY